MVTGLEASHDGGGVRSQTRLQTGACVAPRRVAAVRTVAECPTGESVLGGGQLGWSAKVSRRGFFITVLGDECAGTLVILWRLRRHQECWSADGKCWELSRFLEA